MVKRRDYFRFSKPWSFILPLFYLFLYYIHSPHNNPLTTEPSFSSKDRIALFTLIMKGKKEVVLCI
jgi:hypothetical protein